MSKVQMPIFTSQNKPKNPNGFYYPSAGSRMSLTEKSTLGLLILNSINKGAWITC